MVAIWGGFTDQLLHLFFGKGIEILYNKKVKYDIIAYGEDSLSTDCLGNKNRKFVLNEIFDDIEIVSNEEAQRISEIMRITKDNVNEMDKYLNECRLLYFNANTSYPRFIYKYDSIRDRILSGLCLQEKIFQKLGNDDLENLNTVNRAEVPVSVHVRRGDYVEYLKASLRGGGVYYS